MQPQKNQYRKELGGKRECQQDWTCPQGLGDLKQVSDLHMGATVWIRGETLQAESQTVDLWQPKQNENETVLSTAIHTPERDTGPLEGEADSQRLWRNPFPWSAVYWLETN